MNVASRFRFLLLLSLVSAAARHAAGAGNFTLVRDGHAAPIVFDAADHRVVEIAATALAGDIEKVTGTKPAIAHDVPAGGGAVVIGSIDRSPIIRRLIDAKKIDVADLQGQWESFKQFQVDGNLILVGSDRRGTAFGVFDVSRSIGVSPWVWWADVPPRRQTSIVIPATAARQGPPSVKYRGIFLNDEDWGLQPWAAKTFEPEAGNIGPKTYARIFELLLRLKANYCWPAMHPGTKPFNAFPQNKQVADNYAIVMGSSHAEPMLRNNVGEWPHDGAKDWNAVTNLPAILAYWEQRVAENARFESTWTIGMRGVHDSGMPGGGTIDEKRDRLQHIIQLQREMLARHVNRDVTKVPQIFCPYKEVLEIYRAGLKVPDDVTLVWPDDNFGFVRQFPNDQERKRSGGNGVYYHLSYNGRPHDYLWLESIAPAQVWEEMTKAYARGAQRLWVVNVGDLKPIEAGMTLFLEMGWDIHRYRDDVQREFLRRFYDEQFGNAGAEIADIKDRYFRLCAIRKPETLGWNTTYPTTPVRDGEFSPGEAARFVDDWRRLAARATELAEKMPAEQQPAYFELVQYPVCAAAVMAEKMIAAETSRHLAARGELAANDFADRAEAAYRRIEQLTGQYNDLLNGKWRGMMDAHPRKLPVFDPPQVGRVPATATSPAAAATNRATTEPSAASAGGASITIDAVHFDRLHDRDQVRVVAVEGLGRRGGALTTDPTNGEAVRWDTAADIQAHAPVAEYDIDNARAGAVIAVVEALPTHPIFAGRRLICGLSIDDAPPRVVEFAQSSDETDKVWQQNVLRDAMFGRIKLDVPVGRHTLKLWFADASVIVEHITLDFGRGGGGGGGGDK